MIVMIQPVIVDIPTLPQLLVAMFAARPWVLFTSWSVVQRVMMEVIVGVVMQLYTFTHYVTIGPFLHLVLVGTESVGGAVGRLVQGAVLGRPVPNLAVLRFVLRPWLRPRSLPSSR